MAAASILRTDTRESPTADCCNPLERSLVGVGDRLRVSGALTADGQLQLAVSGVESPAHPRGGGRLSGEQGQVASIGSNTHRRHGRAGEQETRRRPGRGWGVAAPVAGKEPAKPTPDAATPPGSGWGRALNPRRLRLSLLDGRGVRGRGQRDRRRRRGRHERAERVRRGIGRDCELAGSVGVSGRSVCHGDLLVVSGWSRRPRKENTTAGSRGSTVAPNDKAAAERRVVTSLRVVLRSSDRAGRIRSGCSTARCVVR
jgi:hypothetical protein